jgi:cellulose synthase/poly-beta-1,6-N-acetylglucosamine synthase-like glycosyltransferase
MSTGTSDQPLVCIVIPTYEEEENIRRGALQEVTEYLSSQDYESEVIVVDEALRELAVDQDPLRDGLRMLREVLSMWLNALRASVEAGPPRKGRIRDGP